MVSVKKIYHRNRYQIGIYFPVDEAIKQKCKELGAKWSQTYKCWYIEYNKENYNALKFVFAEFDVLNDENEIVLKIEPDFKRNQEIAHIDLPKVQIELRQHGEVEHKIEKSEIIKTDKVNASYEKEIGKYWILKVPYSADICNGMKQIKGVFWNKQYKAYMIYRHVAVKTKVEALLGMPNLLPNTFYHVSEADNYSNGEIILHPCVEDKRVFLVEIPNSSVLIHQIKRLQGSRFSKNYNCYCLPAAPIMLLNLGTMAQNSGMKLVNNLPDRYLKKGYTPNVKRIRLESTYDKLQAETPAQAQVYVNALIDYLMAKNYSYNTLKSYTGAFLLFLRENNYPNPNELSQEFIIRHLGKMMQRGLSAATAHTLVNALLFYYVNVLKRNGFELQLPRPKMEHKLPSVLTKAECMSIFANIQNPKHRLLLLLGYGAGLRLSEIVHLKWSDILFAEHKIHVKAGKGNKDRLVMLPYSIIEGLDAYRKLQNSVNDWVFEGQYKGEPYSASSVQQIMRTAVEKAGLTKKASVHTLRHSFATHLLEEGTNLRYIQALLGHSSIKTTTIYTHLSEKKVLNVHSPLDTMQLDLMKKELK